MAKMQDLYWRAEDRAGVIPLLEFINKPTLYRTMILLYNYVKKTKRKSFTYRQLQVFWSKNGFTDLHWHTVERCIRELASIGYLRRRILRGKRIAVFYITEKAEAWFQNYEQYLDLISQEQQSERLR